MASKNLITSKQRIRITYSPARELQQCGVKNVWGAATSRLITKEQKGGSKGALLEWGWAVGRGLGTLNTKLGLLLTE